MAQKSRRFSKGLVVEGISTPVQNPGTKLLPSCSKSKLWEFDFETPQRNDSKKTVTSSETGECSLHTEEPTQAIQFEDEESSPMSSPILTLSEPAFKRLRLHTAEQSGIDLPTSTVRSLDFDTSDVVLDSVTDNSDVELSNSFDIIESSQDDGEANSRNSRLAEPDHHNNQITATEWLRKISSKSQVSRLQGKMVSEDGGSISSYSSPSASQQVINVEPIPEDLTFNSSKKKKRPKFGLAVKLDAVLKNHLSDQVLRSHMITNNFPTCQTQKGKILSVEKICQSVIIISCKSFTIAANSMRTHFKLIVGHEQDPDLLAKLKVGNSVIISAPWNIVNGTILNFNKIDIFENEHHQGNSKSQFQNIILSDCKCFTVS